MLLFRRRGGRRPEFRRDRKNLVSCRIKCHGASAFLGRHILRHTEVVWGFLSYHRQNAFSARSECQASLWIIGCGIYTFTNRNCGDELAAVGVHDRHHFVVAGGKESPILAIDSKPTWFLTRS